MTLSIESVDTKDTRQVAEQMRPVIVFWRTNALLCVYHDGVC